VIPALEIGTLLRIFLNSYKKKTILFYLADKFFLFMGFPWSFFLLNKKQGIITKGLFSSFIEIVIKLKLFGILIYCLCFFLDRGEQSSTHESKHKLEKVFYL
jgi:hypothetical protein